MTLRILTAVHTKYTVHPENTRSSPNAGLMLGQRRRRLPNNKPTLGERLEFCWAPDRRVTSSGQPSSELSIIPSRPASSGQLTVTSLTVFTCLITDNHPPNHTLSINHLTSMSCRDPPFKPYSAEIFLYKPQDQIFFSIIINVLVSSFRFI